VTVLDKLTHAGNLANLQLVSASVYHATSSGQTTWLGFARDVSAPLGGRP
jgi:dTDP-4-dehydrorhamnose reductase